MRIGKAEHQYVYNEVKSCEYQSTLHSIILRQSNSTAIQPYSMFGKSRAEQNLYTKNTAQSLSD